MDNHHVAALVPWDNLTQAMQLGVAVAYEDWYTEALAQASDEVEKVFLRSQRDLRHNLRAYPVWAYGFARLDSRYADPLQDL
jgi:hypothetical protein